jgi:hypothetical protein
VTNKLPDTLLLDYSCTDNIEKKFLSNSYQRVCLTLAKITDSVYKSYPSDPEKSSDILQPLVKRYGEVSSLKITSFRHMLKFPRVVPELVKLFLNGGLFSIECEEAFQHLLKCRVEGVMFVLLLFKTSNIFLD